VTEVKEASVGEEKRKEKEALRVEREKEEEKRKHDEEVLKAARSCKRAVIAGPVQVGN
jgi:translation initiation factor IF-2